MNAGDQNDWSTDLLLGGVGALIGFVIGLGCRQIPAPSMATCLGAAAFCGPVFVIAHYSTGSQANRLIGRCGQLLIGVVGGFMMALVIQYP